MDNNIHINAIFNFSDWTKFKIHVAQKAGTIRPIDVFTSSFETWQNGWNGDYHSNHCWNREYIFSIIELPEKKDCWLFGGIFEVISHEPGKDENGKDGIIYEVKLNPQGEALIGRLIISWEKDARAKGRKAETIINAMSVSEILPKKYIGEDFPGYANINHNYGALEKLWSDNKQDWKVALSHTQGVYLITDMKTGLRYVGSAYGEEGIWSRWGTYFSSGGHANNKLLKEHLLEQENCVEYARENLKFSLLEQASSRDSEQYIINRESYWKEVLLTRTDFGLNDN